MMRKGVGMMVSAYIRARRVLKASTPITDDDGERKV
jgi:hypothetical protein